MLLTEAKDVSTDWGMKPQCKVSVSASGETHDKDISLNQPMINYLVHHHGKSSNGWIGKTIEVTTKFIKGNDAIVPKDEYKSK